MVELTHQLAFKVYTDFKNIRLFSTFKMLRRSKRLKPSTIHDVLPQEIFVMVLRFLDYRSIITARGTCKTWRSIIDQFHLITDCMKDMCKYSYYWFIWNEFNIWEKSLLLHLQLENLQFWWLEGILMVQEMSQLKI